MQCVQIKTFHKIIFKIYKIYSVDYFQLLTPYFNYGVTFKSSFHLAFKATIIIVSKVFLIGFEHVFSPQKDDVDLFLYPYNSLPHIYDWYCTFTHIIQFH
jgi:hypothetical protein